MRLSVGGIFAKCDGCDGDRFDPVVRLTSETRNVFTCAACGKPVHYRELERQIGREAVRRAKLAAEARPSSAL